MGLLDSCGLVVIITDDKGTVDECNNLAADLVHREKEELLGSDLITDHMKPVWHPKGKAALEGSVSGQSISDVKVSMVGKENGAEGMLAPEQVVGVVL